ncbi:MAG TPA: protein kinase, partial [Pyrinomonadaceae bacterium]|nr:protein kinase [Pyrinomonadaceae bacterium]
NNSDSFIELPAGDIAAQLLGCLHPRFEPGQHIENYEIIRQLGSGGMGEVYLAQDLRLGRQIALKLLPVEFTTHREHVRRFEFEARAASALNHPNIITIHEIGRSDTSHFIATEYVDGLTLRQYMAGLPSEFRMSIAQVLDIAIQIGSALAAAHAAGIVHRDIKPENVMLRHDGFVKVLDFGLAKLSRQIVTTETAMVNTNPGVVMGTVRYMSPEQARGFEVDSRTDIWSLGVVLYEMLTARVPFRGATPSHVIVSILEKTPVALSTYSEVPPELERIVTKALRKDRGRRYQSAGDLVLELKNLKQELETQAHLQKPLRQLRKGFDLLAGDEVDTAEDVLAASTVRLDAPISTSTNPHPAKSPLNYMKLAALGALILAVGFGLYKFVTRNDSSLAPTAPFQGIELLRLTNSGRVSDSAISPDGKYVSYVVESGGKQSIWIREVANSNNTQIVAPKDSMFYGGTFSREGDYLYYIDKERNNTIGTLYRVPSLGGVPVKLIKDVDGPIALSPDEKQLAFVRGASTGERALMLANVDGSGERKLASRMGYESFSFSGPAWSPDSKGIVCGAAYTLENERFLTLVQVDISDASIRQLTTQKWKAIGRVTWLHDGKGLLFTATEQRAGSTSQLWYMDYPSGKAYRISKDLQDYHGASVTTDARTLVTKQTETLSSLWIAPNGDANLATEILSHKDDDGFNNSYYYRTRFSWMPDGRIMYTSLVNGTPSLWVMKATGSEAKQITSDTSDSSFPSVTPDSRYIIFVSETLGFSKIWRMNIDGSNRKQLTNGPDESWSWCSPDSQWVVYHSGNQGRRTVWRVPIEGGTPQQLTDYPSVTPVVSPDGQWISIYYRSETKAPWRLGIIPFNGGPPVKSFEVPQGVLFQSLVRFTPDGSALAYIMNKDGSSNIWIQPLDGGPARQLTHFNSDQIFWFEWSPDGKQLGVSRGAITSDVVMIRR